MTEAVLVIGGGGREHALAWKLAQSPQVRHVFVSPGNAGTERGVSNISNVLINLKKFDAVVSWCKQHSVALVCVGPEDPLAAGISDVLTAAGIKCFGPSAKAAQIEASKAFSKAFMDRHNIPTARWKSFTNAQEACDHIKSAPYPALVVKASGLAAGKGVIVASNQQEACEAVDIILKDKTYGSAGDEVVIEELLEGEEVSCLCFTDGSTISCMPPAQDHKRLLDGDLGPNTGGMGAYCPCPQVSQASLELIEKQVLQKTVDGMRAEEIPYVGVLYAGLMLTSNGPKVLEFNCRFGDPETQVLIPLIKTDLFATMLACVDGKLPDAIPEFRTDRAAVGVVVVSGGYPNSYKKGMEISGLDKLSKDPETTVFHAGTAMKEGKIVTSGGRVLAVVAIDTNIQSAASKAQQGADIIQYDGAFYRRDIAHRAIAWSRKGRGLKYKDAGVDIAAGDNLVNLIKPAAAATARHGCTAELGQFGGLFDCKAAGYKDPLLISGTDGVGTKLKIAQACNKHDSIGIDLVAMCVNDVLAHGAEPLYFLDYFACGKLNLGVAEKVIKGIAHGCRLAGCALLGGETAEMPGMYDPGCYDLAGFTVGALERHQYLPRSRDIKNGDVVIGLSSSGLHSNGFSLVRKLVEQQGIAYSDPSPFMEGKTLGESLLIPTRIYSKTVLPSLRSGKVKAFAHITGGGLIENIPRVLPSKKGVQLCAGNWDLPPVFSWIYKQGNVESLEMVTTFNCGIGAVLIVSPSDADAILNELSSAGEKAWKIGSVVPCFDCPRVLISQLEHSLNKVWNPPTTGEHVNGAVRKRKKVGVLISGSGTNLQALIDHTQNPAVDSAAEIVVVISNKAGVKGLERARKAGIPTQVVNHKDFPSRLEFDLAVSSILEDYGVEYVCLAGFMRILTGDFVRKWEGRLLNIHPSLLPSFKGAHAHKLVLEQGVRVSGCTVHFVAEEVDSGAILVQEVVPVEIGDTEETLAERVKTVEHKAFPKALELLASGKAKLGENNKVIWSD
ncbi:trifunctional purine biosynthetic protein adenosine-3 [Lingula anatina]|uniref:Trifunctional purine biosynthetic protein adenosine-3 n=1 Tax=Lingula anatina TaxID=7574 RepID=A0A1S3I6X1_LINAN|nr:trifunctional purine biosynthetic protein adenosine-3 [Lingula anatina]|eukprot:XP_013393591.1 trifunctional purine biosynthetic protein adenosine-3 [Lingula anatina]